MAEIICISAADKARADKESVAKLLKEELKKENKRVLIARFADPIKHICRDWFGWNGLMDDVGRSFLRYVGTEIVRARRPDFWVDFMVGLLSMLGSEWDYVIIPDCRQPNELDMERYGFQPRHIRVEGKGAYPAGPLGNTAPDFTIKSDSPRLRSDVAAVAQNLVYA